MKNRLLWVALVIALIGCNQKNQEVAVSVDEAPAATIAAVQAAKSTEEKVIKEKPDSITSTVKEIHASNNAGPFGISKGMTLDDLKAYNPQPLINGGFELNGVPMPHEKFMRHTVFLTRETGVCGLYSLSNVIETNSSGDELKAEYQAMLALLTSKYGEPSSEVDELKSDSLFKKPEQWMLSLRYGDRTYRTYWLSHIGGKNLPYNLEAISLGANAITGGHVQLELHYSFDNANDCEAIEQAKKSVGL